MAFVKRNNSGDIVDLSLTAPNRDTGMDWIDENDPELIKYLRTTQAGIQLKSALSDSDSDMMRVVEDIVDLLIGKQVFVFTELPEVVQQKLQSRKKLRHDIQSLSNLIQDDDKLF